MSVITEVKIDAGERCYRDTMSKSSIDGPTPFQVSFGQVNLIFEDSSDALEMAKSILWKLGGSYDDAEYTKEMNKPRPK